MHTQMRGKVSSGKLITLLAVAAIVIAWACNNRIISLSAQAGHDTLALNPHAKGNTIEITVHTGKALNMPLYAIWLTTADTQYIQTLYVSKAMGTGIFTHGTTQRGKWEPGPVRRPEALPVWSHKRGVKELDKLYVPTPHTAMPDAYTGATPSGNFTVHTRTEEALPDKGIIFLEVNQPWDWNTYWTTSKYPNSEAYKRSGQPSLVYAANFTSDFFNKKIELMPIGHGHYSGKNGNLYTELNTLTSALNILKSVTCTLR